MSVFVAGACNDTATGPVDSPGNPADPGYLFMASQFTETAIVLAGLEWHEAVEDSIPGAVQVRGRSAGATHDSLVQYSVDIDSASAWIIIQATLLNVADTIEIVDSVRFTGPDGQYAIPSDAMPLDSMVSMDMHMHADAHANDSAEFIGSLHHASWLELVVLDRDEGLGLITFQINLTQFDTLHGTSFDSTYGTCDVDITSQKTVTDLIEIDELGSGDPGAGLAAAWKPSAAHEGCPLSGSVVVHMTVDVVCTGGITPLTIDAAWLIEATFVGGSSADLTFTSDNLYWNSTADCDEFSDL
jgi:hypothetical protein